MATGETHEGMTLGNVADGLLEARFQGHLVDALEAFEELGDRSGKVKITLEVELETKGGDNPTVQVAVTSKLSKPTPRKTIRFARISGGQLLVEVAVQTELPFATSTVITPIERGDRTNG